MTRETNIARKVRERVYLTYPTRLIKEPLIYQVGHKFKVVTNIRGANINDTIGLVALELDGTQAEVDRAIAWLRDKGVNVEPIEKNVIE
ncbi:MAG: NIL domain-containing protein [Deltaproteobacteria bacterium]|nr:NIL domain-containing protein [Deltaproteobacteria bacterium]MBI3391452.1 NIL domain-containing protein [Deltaproteobacteria bacterium]